MKDSGPFRLKAGEFRHRAEAAETPLARQRLEETAKRLDSLADELDGAGDRQSAAAGVEPPRRAGGGWRASG